MGGVFSSIVRGLRTARIALSALRSISAEFEQVLERARGAPGLPVPEPTAPYWLDDPPFPDLANRRSDALPERADVAVIGSGIAAAATARSILHDGARTGRPLRVVVLEARSLCSGATGRNGGHIKASPRESFVRLRKTFGPERAAELCRFQLRHLDVLIGLCEAEGIDVAECRAVETVDLFIDEENFEKALRELEELKGWVPEFEATVWKGDEMRKRFGTNHLVIGAISYKAGAMWPYRFVTSIWRTLMDGFPKLLAIETSTPVLSLAVGASASHPYLIETPRGQIEAKHIVHATNGFASQFLPVLRGKMLGALAHMTSQRPGSKFGDVNGNRSWSIFYGNFFDYITQRPSKEGIPGDILLGGGFGQSVRQGMDQLGVYDDSQLDALTTAHNLGIMAALFEPKWGPEAPGWKPGKLWSGIIGITADFVPLVGRLDPELTGRAASANRNGREVEKTANATVEPSEWVAAGFCGDGMVWAWLSGMAVGLMITGAQNDDLPAAPGRVAGRLVDWFPAALWPTPERIKRMDLANLADELV